MPSDLSPLPAPASRRAPGWAPSSDPSADPPQVCPVRPLVMLMSDLRGFASLCERTPPQLVHALLQRYLLDMSAEIERAGGALNDLHGDAIVAVFEGGPSALERGVSAAIGMQNSLERLNAEHRAAGLPLLEMGVGVHMGEVALAALGPPGFSRVALVGQHANLTSRIESFSVGGQILVSSAVAHPLMDRLQIRDSFVATPKGFDEEVTVYDVAALSGAHGQALIVPPDELVVLPRPIEVAARIVDGKQVVGPLLSGHVVRISPRRAELRLGRPLRGLTEIRLEICPELTGEWVYAKTVPGGAEGCAMFRFTALPQRSRDRIDALVARLSAVALTPET